jgi:hypothetical protein
MPTKSYTATPAQVEHLRAELGTNGVTVPAGNSGEITGRGIVADFTYDGEASLSITVKSKPFWMPASAIFANIQSALETA